MGRCRGRRCWTNSPTWGSGSRCTGRCFKVTAVVVSASLALAAVGTVLEVLLTAH